MCHIIKPEHKCGIVAVSDAHHDAPNMAFRALRAQQNRGQQGAGLAIWRDGGEVEIETGFGLVHAVFASSELSRSRARVAIGHCRYATTGDAEDTRNLQPCRGKYCALAHNGNVFGYETTRQKLISAGVLFSSDSDSEVMMRHIEYLHDQGMPFDEAIAEGLKPFKGAYCIVILHNNGTLYATRDRYGVHPLCIGVPNHPSMDSQVVIASESSAFAHIDCHLYGEVLPGELITIDIAGTVSRRQIIEPGAQAVCWFEFVYFAKDNSEIGGYVIRDIRTELGRQLGHEMHRAGLIRPNAIVVPVLRSGLWYAIGLAQELNLELVQALQLNPDYADKRAFMGSSQVAQEVDADKKLYVVHGSAHDRHLVEVDDSIVRGNATQKNSAKLRGDGALTITVGIGCPPVRHPCRDGIAFQRFDELAARRRTVEDIRRYIGVDALHFLSLEAMRAVCPDLGRCFACWDGKYQSHKH